MASRQNTETEPQEPQDATPAENNTANCNNSQTANTTAPNRQDKAMEQQLLKHTSAPSRISTSPPETLDPALDPSSLPPPDPSLETGNCSTHGDAVQPSTPACLRDGNWFLKLLQAETGRMEGWCQQMEQETKDNKLSEEGKWQNYIKRLSKHLCPFILVISRVLYTDTIQMRFKTHICWHCRHFTETGRRTANFSVTLAAIITVDTIAQTTSEGGDTFSPDGETEAFTHIQQDMNFTASISSHSLSDVIYTWSVSCENDS